MEPQHDEHTERRIKPYKVPFVRDTKTPRDIKYVATDHGRAPSVEIERVFGRSFLNFMRGRRQGQPILPDVGFTIAEVEIAWAEYKKMQIGKGSAQCTQCVALFHRCPKHTRK